MAESRSLADSAVAALAAVSRMDMDVTNEDDERHHIRTLKRLAEQTLSDAFRHATELAYLAEDVRKTNRQRREYEASRG
jgi:hypothetical protein